MPRIENIIHFLSSTLFFGLLKSWCRYYDDRYRPIQVITQNQLGGTDRTSTLYDFVGNVLKSKTTHENGTGSKTITKRYEYDHASRLLRTYHQINSLDEVIISEFEYNELGQIIDKKLHSTDGVNFAQSIDFRYNIRNWLTRINDSNLSDGEGDYFGMELAYNEDFGSRNTPLYNGNVSAAKWSADFSGHQRLYNYGFDPLNRLTDATYKANKGTGWTEDVGKFNMSAGFDLNGNLKQLTRYNGNPDPMDDLRYTYDGNKLLYINDLGDHNKGFLEGNAYTDDFTYDANGNLIRDRNKNLMDTDYTHNNLVNRVENKDGSYVKYIYDANAVKLAEEEYTSDDQLVKRRDYVGTFTYIDGELKYINHKEGQVLFNNGSITEYNYDLKDHLGNTRIRFTTKQDIDTLGVTFEEDRYFDEVPEVRNYTRISNDLFDHTDGGTDYIYSQMLTGANNSIVGLAKEISVIQGDTIRADVYAKYFNPTNTDSDVTAFLAGSIAGAFGVPPAISGEASALGAINDLFGPGSFFGSGDNWTSGDAPRAYLNAIVFDRDYNVVNLAFDQIDVSAEQPVGDATKHPHDQLSLELIIDQPGYVYLYVSNETPKLVEVYFDDLEIRYHRSPIIQQDDYYPYGMSIAETAFQKDNPFYEGSSFANRFGFKDLGFRRYDPASGRFFSPDPLSELQLDQSTYQFAANNPVKNIDELGLGPLDGLLDLFRSKKKRVQRDRELVRKGKRDKRKFDNQGNRKKDNVDKTKHDGQNGSGDNDSNSSSQKSDQDNPDQHKFQDFAFDFDQEKNTKQDRNNNENNLSERSNSTQRFLRLREPETEQEKNKRQSQRKATLTEQLNEKYRNNLQRKDNEIFRENVRQGGYDMAVILQRLNSNADLSEKVVEDQADLSGNYTNPFGMTALVETVKSAGDLGQGQVEISQELQMVEKEYDVPASFSLHSAAKVDMDGKIVDMEINTTIGPISVDAGTVIELQLDSYEVSETSLHFGKFGDYVTYTFRYKKDGVLVDPNKIQITVKKEDAYDFEEYMGLEHSIDRILDSSPTITAEEIREARELIEGIEDETAKAEAYEKLQEKVPYHSQTDNENEEKYSMCNVTSLAPCLEYLGVENPEPSMQFEDYLWDLATVQNSFGRPTNIKSRRKLAKKFGAKIVDINLEGASDTKLRNVLKGALGKGYGVMLSIKGGPGHLVRLQEVTDDGLIVDDPYGVVDLNDRVTNGEGYNGTTNSDNEPEKGNNNLWKWEDIDVGMIVRADFIIKN